MSDQPAESSCADAREQFAAALRLLTRDASLSDVQSAVAMLEQASAAGLGAAGERLAAFHAMAANGPGGPDHWFEAFDQLEIAAGHGSTAAATQLLLLADPSREPSIPDAPDPGFWSAVKSRISLDRLLASPERRSLSDSPRIRVIGGFATAPECRWLIAASRDRLSRATVLDRATGALVEDPARNNSALSLMFTEMHVVAEILRTRIAFATRVPVRVFEPAQILRYEVGQEFVPHHDFLDAASPGFQEELAACGQRLATFLIYLNDDFEGGDTAFPKLGLRHRGRTGDAVFWANLDRENRPDPLTLHAGMPPTSGEKWVLSQWIRERPAQPLN